MLNNISDHENIPILGIRQDIPLRQNMNIDLHKYLREMVYDGADLTLQTPDIIQIAEKLWANKNIYWKHPHKDNNSIIETEGEFFDMFLGLYQEAETLRAAHYPGVNLNIQNLLGDNGKVIFWTQGHKPLQHRKAELILERVAPERHHSQSICAEEKKVPLLRDIIIEAREQGIQSFILIDDRANNVNESHGIMSGIDGIDFYTIQKIRPDRETKNKVESLHNRFYTATWENIYEISAKFEQPFLVICDLDGVIYNTTIIRNAVTETLCKIATKK